MFIFLNKIQKILIHNCHNLHFSHSVLTFHCQINSSRITSIPSKSTNSYTRTKTDSEMSVCLQYGLLIIFYFAHCPGIKCDINRLKILDDDYHVEWRADFQTQNITFTITAKTLGFVGFGISPAGGMKSADIIIGGIQHGKPYFADYHAIGKQAPIVDARQDWALLSASENETHTTLKVTRVFNTCDNEDVSINNDTTKIIWAIGNSDNILYHQRRGAASVNILDAPASEWNSTESDEWHIDVKMELPSEDTVYWCTAHKSPRFDVKRHIVGFRVKLETIEARTYTHHLVLQHCTGSSDQLKKFYERMLKTHGDHCYKPNDMFKMQRTCKKYLYAWAVGGDPLILPENIGIPINALGLPEYFLLEVHYVNPSKLSDLKFNTGIEIYTTTNLRKQEAGIIRIAQKTGPGLMIPPNTSNYIIPGHCSGTCTEDLLPEEGINVFTLFLHSHLAGRKMKLRQFRNAIELPWWAYDNNYDFNFQQNRLLPAHQEIYKGDHLTLECTYDSSHLSPPGAILGGLSTSQEMCMAFLMYYPRMSRLDNCGSHFDEKDLMKKLGIEGFKNQSDPWDIVVTSPPEYANKLYSEVLSYEIPWNDTLKLEVQKLTRFGDHIEVCQPQDLMAENPQTVVTYPEFKPYIPKNDCDKDAIMTTN